MSFFSTKRKRFLRRCLAVSLCIVTAVTSCGCWDSREFSDIAVVMGIAVDVCEDKESEDSITVSVQVANPVPVSGSSDSGGSGGQKEAHSDFSDDGNNIVEVMSSITHSSSRRLYSAHNQIVVFGKKLAEGEGLGQSVDYFLRDNELRYSVLVAVADGKASEALSASTNYESVPAKELAELIKNQASNSGSAICTLLEFAQSGISEGTVALVPIVRLKEAASSETGGAEGDSGGEKSSESSGGSEGGSSGNAEKNYEVTGAAVFVGSKMIGELDEKETRGALWVRNKVSRAIIEAKLTDDIKIAAEVFDCTVSVDVDINGEGKAVSNVKCKVYANLAQISGYGGKISEELTDKVSESCGKTVEEEIKAAYKKSVEMGCDVFGFGNKIRSKDIKKWCEYSDSWQSLFDEAELNIDVSVRIEDIGDLTAEVPWKESDESEGDKK